MKRNRPVPDVSSAAVEKAELEARKKGHAVTEQPLQGGSIRLRIVESA